MSPLLYVIRRSLVNTVKGLRKKPGILVLYILLALLFIGMIVMMFWVPGNINRGDPALFRSIMAGLAAVLTYFSLKQGIEKGSSFFRAADVNLVFTGPFRPNNVLLYGFIRQLGGMLAATAFACFQIPNIRNNFPITPNGIPVILLAVALAALSFPVFGMAVYAFTSKSAARKRLANGLLNAAVIAVLLVFLYKLYDTRDLMKAVYGVFDSPAMPYVPIVGWVQGVAAAAVDGIGWPFFMGLGLMVAAIAAFVAILYRLNLDFYEEVLVATEQREALIAAKKEGTSMQLGAKARHVVKQPIFGSGAAALFGKNMLELRKSSFILFFDRTSLIVIVSALAFKFIMPKEIGAGMFLVLSFSVYMLFLLQMQGRWPQELGRHFIFTLPARPSEKLFFVTAGDHIKNAVDGTALFVIAGVVLQSTAPVVIACILSYLMLGAVFIYGDIMARRVFGSVHSKPLAVFLKMFLTIFVIAPGIALSIVASVLGQGELVSIIAFGGWAAAAAAAVYFIAAGIFKNIEVGA